MCKAPIIFKIMFSFYLIMLIFIRMSWYSIPFIANCAEKGLRRHIAWIVSPDLAALLRGGTRGEFSRMVPRLWDCFLRMLSRAVGAMLHFQKEKCHRTGLPRRSPAICPGRKPCSLWVKLRGTGYMCSVQREDTPHSCWEVFYYKYHFCCC